MKHHIVISIDVENAFDSNSISIPDFKNTFSKPETEVNVLNPIKNLYEKCTVNIVFKSQRLKPSLKKLGTMQ